MKTKYSKNKESRTKLYEIPTFKWLTEELDPGEASGVRTVK